MSIQRSLVLSALLVAACGEDYATGTLEVTVYGEDYIEDTIPSDELVDGWTITFDSFVVSIGGPAAQAGHDAAEVSDPAFALVDLAQPSGGEGYSLATIADAPGGIYDHFGYVIRAEPTAIALNVDAAVATAMTTTGTSIWMTGTATDGTTTKTFDWSFDHHLVASHCEADLPLDGGTLTLQATIHGDHMFLDDAVSDAPNVAFQTLADADAGPTPDGVITLAELDAVLLAGLARYQVGSLPIDNLGDFIRHMATTLPHANGEGHCDIAAQ
jgi:hypothetical protein